MNAFITVRMSVVLSLRDRLTASTAELEADKAEHASMLIGVKALELRIERRSIEVETWAKAVAVVENEQPDAHEAPMNESRVSQPRGRRRGPKGTWKAIMGDLARRVGENEFGYADVTESGTRVGQSLDSNKIRPQMSNYVGSGWLAREHDGRFRFTEPGLAVLAGLSNAPGTASPDKESPAADDVQAAGVSAGDGSP